MQANSYKLKDGAHLTIREAVPADAPVLVEFVEGVSAESDFLSFGPGEFGVSADEEKEVLENYRSTGGKVYLVAIVDERIVGSLSFAAGSRIRTQHAGEFGMSVSQAFWGKGVGSLLLNTLLEWASQQPGIEKINLSVRTDNERAIRLYLKKGFAFEGRIRDQMRIDGQSHDVYCMGRTVS